MCSSSRKRRVDLKYQFYVLLGADYAGKSALLEKMQGHPGWRPISYDDALLDERHQLLSNLKKDFFRSLSKGHEFSADFLLTGFQMSIVYLRDQALGNLPRSNVLVDSYYYKILAKCILKGLSNPAIFELWRTFPKPDHILLLDIDGDLQWQRAQRCGRLNAFEYYGKKPTRKGFIDFQQDLHQFLTEETRKLPVKVIHPEASFEGLERRVMAALNGSTTCSSQPPHSKSIQTQAKNRPSAFC